MTIGRGRDMRQYDTQSAPALSYVVTNSRVGSQNLVILVSLWSEKAPESALGDINHCVVGSRDTANKHPVAGLWITIESSCS